MKVIFRLNYYTIPGQTLWVNIATVIDGTDARVEQLVPLRWINAQQWQTEYEIKATCSIRLEYGYQFRQEGNGVLLDEWAGPRMVHVLPSELDVLWLRDTWCSAGTVDYAFESKAFKAVLPERGPFAQSSISGESDHEFRLHMSAVPAGMIPCLLGGVSELGSWEQHLARPMQEVAANQWCLHVRLPKDQEIHYKYGLWDLNAGCALELESGDDRTLEGHELAVRQRCVIQDEGYRRKPSMLYRAAGVAVPVFSLRGERSLGVGEFADLKDLADWSQQVGLQMIQILPINDTTSSHTWRDSYPYSAISVFALHPLYLRIEGVSVEVPLEILTEVEEERQRLNALAQVDYEQVMQVKARITRRLFQQNRNSLVRDRKILDFLTDHYDWLVPYAVFCVKRDEYGTADFSRWGDWASYDSNRVQALLRIDHPQHDQVFYHIWLQYELDRQMNDAVAHLHGVGVVLKGDLPIGIDRESVEAWSAPHLFKMGSQAGAPPDAFSDKGQNWGFPTYDWQVMAQDGYAWWRSRFAHLSRYFDAFRIDHILGFFRIWQVPMDQVEGIMGFFDPVLPVELEEFRKCGILFDKDRFCEPYIPASILTERFGGYAAEVESCYLEQKAEGLYRLRDEVSTQRKVIDHFATWDVSQPEVRAKMECFRQGLLDCLSDVLFFEVPHSGGLQFHPRFFLQKTQSFAALDERTQERVDGLYVNYFFRRQDDFWQARGLEKLPAMRRATEMLLCGEDLGLVPDCVPGVMRDLGILSLEIQRMPKTLAAEFSHPGDAPYLSVVSPSTHDMSTLREWWREDPCLAARFAWLHLGEAHPPAVLNAEMAERIFRQHIESPAMWAVFPLQDFFALDEQLRHPNPESERINVPAIMPYYWRYRMHLRIKNLLEAEAMNGRIARLLRKCGRSRGKEM